MFDTRQLQTTVLVSARPRLLPLGSLCRLMRSRGHTIISTGTLVRGALELFDEWLDRQSKLDSSLPPPCRTVSEAVDAIRDLGVEKLLSYPSVAEALALEEAQRSIQATWRPPTATDDDDDDDSDTQGTLPAVPPDSLLCSLPDPF